MHKNVYLLQIFTIFTWFALLNNHNLTNVLRGQITQKEKIFLPHKKGRWANINPHLIEYSIFTCLLVKWEFSPPAGCCPWTPLWPRTRRKASLSMPPPMCQQLLAIELDDNPSSRFWDIKPTCFHAWPNMTLTLWPSIVSGRLSFPVVLVGEP